MRCNEIWIGIQSSYDCASCIFLHTVVLHEIVYPNVLELVFSIPFPRVQGMYWIHIIDSRYLSRMLCRISRGINLAATIHPHLSFLNSNTWWRWLAFTKVQLTSNQYDRNISSFSPPLGDILKRAPVTFVGFRASKNHGKMMQWHIVFVQCLHGNYFVQLGIEGKYQS